MFPEMLAIHDKVRNAKNVIEEMTRRAELESSLSAEQLMAWMDAIYVTKVKVSLPRFKMESSAELAKIFIGLDIKGQLQISIICSELIRS